MKIAVCGCSFSTPTSRKNKRYKELKNTHFSELLEKHYTVINFSNRGVSNYYIRLQVEEAIKHNPDIVILTPTNFPRFEISKKPLTNDNSLYNQICHIGADVNMLSTTFAGSMKNLDITNIEKKAIKLYMKHFYDEVWEAKKQKWIISDALSQLKHHKIPCVFSPWFMHTNEELQRVKNLEVTEYSKIWINLYGCIIPFYESLTYYKKDYKNYHDDPGYHTTVESQKKFCLYLVENTFNKINKL